MGLPLPVRRFVLALCGVLTALIPGGTLASAEDMADAPAGLLARAVASGEPVEDVSMRTENNTTWVNPSGTRTVESHIEPIRARGRDGAWAPVDYTLVQNTDGSWSPRASPQPVRISNGGSVPLMRLSEGGVDLDISWPSRLPKPTVTGSTAIYKDVLPGVDLVVAANSSGVGETLVVRNAKAASNAAVRQISLPVAVRGGKLQRTAAGGLDLVDPTGRVVSSAATPTMWDSSGTAPADGKLTTLGSSLTTEEPVPADGDQIDPIPAEVSSSAIVLRPPSDALAGPDVTYPVYIDPTFSRGPNMWTMVTKKHSTASFYKWDNDPDNDGTANGEGVGLQTFSDPNTLKRLYWQFSVGELPGATIYNARLKARMVWSANCTKKYTSLYRTAGINSSTTWGTQPTWYELQSSVLGAAGYSASCPARDYEWDIKQSAQYGADVNGTQMAFGMRAADETDYLAWRRMLNSASITIEYNHAPNTPTSPQFHVGSTAYDCSSISLGAVADAVHFSALVSDRNGDSVKSAFRYWLDGSPTSTVTTATTFIASGGRSHSPDVGLPRDANGRLASGTYWFYARAKDSYSVDSVNKTVDCKIVVDADAPNPPVVEGPKSVATGSQASFTLAPGPGEIPTSYRYAVLEPDGSTSCATPPAGSVPAVGGRATVTIPTVTSAATKWLCAWAYDAAGNPSGKTTWEFYASATGDTTGWRFGLNEGSGSVAASDFGTAQFTLTGASLWAWRGVLANSIEGSWYRGHTDRQFQFVPTLPGLATADGVATDGNFTVSAWLDPTVPTSGPRTAWTLQTATGEPLVKLQVTTAGHYALAVRDGANWQTPLVATGVGETDDPGLRNVVVTYDHLNRTATMWVAGTPGYSVNEPVEVNAAIPVVVGARSLALGGAAGEVFAGRVDAVDVTTGLISRSDRDQLHATDPAIRRWCEAMYSEDWLVAPCS